MANGMTLAARDHLHRIRWEADRLITKKYIQGQAEHGGDLWRKPGIIDMAIDEAIDLIVYLLTLKEQVEHPDQVDLTLEEKF